MEELERVVRQMFEGSCDNFPRTRKPGMSMTYAPFGLEPPSP